MKTTKRKLPRVAEAKEMIDKLRAGGVTLVGCSLCARLQLKPGAEPAPCPFCGAMVTRKAGRK